MSRENNELPIGKHNHGLLVHLTAAIDDTLQSCVFAAQGRQIKLARLGVGSLQKRVNGTGTHLKE
jgi:hypothetical protein